MILGVLGASLFYGDSVITPAISVLSAIEGLEVTTPSLAHLVVPVGAVIITLLFLAQRFGTHVVGRLFGPIMVVWLVALGLMGLSKIVAEPSIVRGCPRPTESCSWSTIRTSRSWRWARWC